MIRPVLIELERDVTKAKDTGSRNVVVGVDFLAKLILMANYALDRGFTDPPQGE